ncbi:MAG: DUF1730 domain-containing protein [Anaerolineae bacterium]|nr:DUF1730 domain-containing protein [Anaerolineae bacterium]
MRSLKERIKAKAAELGFDLIGITTVDLAPHAQAFIDWLARGYHGEMDYMARHADRRQDPRRLMPEARSMIVLGTRYRPRRLPDSVRDDPSRGLIASYAWGPDYHDWIRPRLFELDAFIRGETGRTTRARCYVDTGPVLERDWAMQAGLGFIGRNTSLIHPQFGPWLFLGVILLPEELEPDTPPTPQRLPSGHPAWHLSDGRTVTCGECARCLTSCPTQALTKPYVLDARRCISYLTIELRGPIPRELRPLMRNWIFGCDICLSVCPWARAQTASELTAAEIELWAPPLLDLLALDEKGFRERFRGTALMRTKRRGVLRNACVAIGNWGSPVAVPALACALRDREPLIRGHAAWALGRVRGSAAWKALTRALATEVDPWVQEEIRYALAAFSR